MVAEEGRSLSFEDILVYTVSSRADKTIYKKKKLLNSWVVVAHTFSPGTWGGRGRLISVSSRPAGLQRELQNSQNCYSEKSHLEKKNKNKNKQTKRCC